MKEAGYQIMLAIRVLLQLGLAVVSTKICVKLGLLGEIPPLAALGYFVLFAILMDIKEIKDGSKK